MFSHVLFMKRYVAAWCFLDDICKILCCFWDYSEQARSGTVVLEVSLNEHIFYKKEGRSGTVVFWRFVREANS